MQGVLEQVPASAQHAHLLLAQARAHIRSSTLICDQDPDGAYALLYDAARKALAAVLANQGLRTTTRLGHHRTVYEVVRAQLDPPLGAELRPFGRMRSLRSAAEYPSLDEAPLTEDHVLADAAKAQVIVEVCAQVLGAMPVYKRDQGQRDLQ